MSIHLHRDLERLQKRIVTMAGDVEEMIEKVVKALFNRDASLAQALMEADNLIDMEENQIEEDCLKILALHQPVAIDLRRVTAILKINSDLERMGDLAENIAERVYSLTQHTDNVPISPLFQQMADLTNMMVRDGLDAFVNLDSGLAKRVCRVDEEVDRLNVDIIKQVLEYMKKDPNHVEPGLNLFSICRQIERIADHATNIAEDVVYLVEGAIIRHHPEALQEME